MQALSGTECQRTVVTVYTGEYAVISEVTAAGRRHFQQWTTALQSPDASATQVGVIGKPLCERIAGTPLG